MVKIETNTTHPAAFLDQPVAAPHQSFLSNGSEVPLDKKSSFPPGEAKGELTFSVYALVGVDEYVDPSAALPPQL